ncbi:MAG: VOC family protein [Rubrivivax sp.]
MMKFDHLQIWVTDLQAARDWYVSTLDLKVEFEAPERETVALQDTAGFTIFLQQRAASRPVAEPYAMWFQVADVDATFENWTARGVRFSHGPRKSFWGYGVELSDPDGNFIRLWDERSMNQH